MKFIGNNRVVSLLGAALLAAVLAACSAGGTQKKTTTGGTPTAASLNVTVDKTTLSSAGTGVVNITATALDADNNVVPSIPVSIKADSGILVPSGTTTDSSGVLTGVLSTGSDHTNRAIDVLVTSGSISKTVVVNVTGNTLTFTSGSTTAGSPATIQYTLADAAGVGLAAVPVSVTLGSQAAVTGTTDASGKYQFQFTMPSAATVVTAKALDQTVTTTVTPSGGTVVVPPAGAVASPSLAANPTSVATGKPTELRALFIGANNAPIPNVRVRFQMVDSNSIGGTLSSDDKDGVTHNVVYSDANGVARTTYTAGTRGGVITAKACWDVNDFVNTACPNAVTASNITVVASGVSVAVLSNSKLVTDDVKNIYYLNYVVQVVDASNQPISGTTVTGSVDIPRFYRGTYVVGGSAWVPVIFDRSLTTPYSFTISASTSRQACDNEDINRNNVLENGEDQNGSGSLDPFKASVTITPTSAGSDVTDAFGKAYFTLQYGQNYASWEDVVMTFTASVEGTEGHATYPTDLPVPVAVIQATDAAPPFVTSPYNLPLDKSTNPKGYPWIVGTNPVANPGVVYSSTPTFYLCQAQQ